MSKHPFYSPQFIFYTHSLLAYIPYLLALYLLRESKPLTRQWYFEQNSLFDVFFNSPFFFSLFSIQDFNAFFIFTQQANLTTLFTLVGFYIPLLLCALYLYIYYKKQLFLLYTLLILSFFATLCTFSMPLFFGLQNIFLICNLLLLHHFVRFFIRFNFLFNFTLNLLPSFFLLLICCFYHLSILPFFLLYCLGLSILLFKTKKLQPFEKKLLLVFLITLFFSFASLTYSPAFIISSLFLACACLSLFVFLGKLFFFEKEQKQYLELREEINALKQEVSEKELLLKELQHRIKNNLTVLLSIIQLHSQQSMQNSLQKVFKELQNNVYAIAALYQSLFFSQKKQFVDIRTYYQNLLHNISLAYGISLKNIVLTCHCDKGYLDANKAMHTGIIINELIANSVKHAFDECEYKEISLAFKTINNTHHLYIKDNGKGIQKHQHLGLNLVKTLASSLQAKLILKNEKGTSYELTFTS